MKKNDVAKLKDYIRAVLIVENSGFEEDMADTLEHLIRAELDAKLVLSTKGLLSIEIPSYNLMEEPVVVFSDSSIYEEIIIDYENLVVGKPFIAMNKAEIADLKKQITDELAEAAEENAEVVRIRAETAKAYDVLNKLSAADRATLAKVVQLPALVKKK